MVFQLSVKFLISGDSKVTHGGVTKVLVDDGARNIKGKWLSIPKIIGSKG